MPLTGREVQKNPTVPALGRGAISLLTQLCFRNDDPASAADAVFLFSNPVERERMVQSIERAIRDFGAKHVIVTGGVSELYDLRGTGRAEADYIMEVVDVKKFPDVRFTLERTSLSTLSNVTEALKLIDLSSFRRIVFVSKAHAAGRCYLTLRKYVPQTTLLQRTWSASYKERNKPITRDNWVEDAFGQSRVWGEYLRIKKYGERDDIAFEEVRPTVEEIGHLTG